MGHPILIKIWFQDFYKQLFSSLFFFLCLEVNCVIPPVLKEGTRIVLFYCTVHFSTQKSETLLESKKYLFSFFFFLSLFLSINWYIKLACIELI